MALKFNCTSCSKEIIVINLKVGEVAKCRNCGVEITVPPTAVETDHDPDYGTPMTTTAEGQLKTIPTHTLADRSDRLVAQIIDGLIYVVLSVPIVFSPESPDLVALVGFATLILVVVQFMFLSIHGQTIGKKALSIKIVTVYTGGNGGFGTNVLLRIIVNAIIVVLFPPYWLIDTLFIFRKDRRCIHDFIAGTRVVCA